MRKGPASKHRNDDKIMFLSILWQLQRLHTKTFTIEDRGEIIPVLMYSSFLGFYLNDS